MDVKNRENNLDERAKFITNNINSYLEMAYALLNKNENRCKKNNIKNFIEFHLDKPCNKISFLAVLLFFDFNGYGCSIPTKKWKLAKLDKFKDSCNYSYSGNLAGSIAETPLKDLRSLAKFFNSEVVKKYYITICGLLLSLERGWGFGITREGIKNYIELKLGEVCNNEILSKVLEIFDVHQKLYSFEENAKTIYLNKKVFGCKLSELVETNPYKCSKEFAYSACYPDITENIKKDYKNVIDVVNSNGVNFFREGIERIVKTYRDIIGFDNIKEYIRIITRNYYFDGNSTIEKVLSTWLGWALWTRQEMDAIASVTLRALNFKNYTGTEDEYTSITDEECREFVLNNDMYLSNIEKNPYEKEEYIDECIKSIKDKSVFHFACSDGLKVDFWMPGSFVTVEHSYGNEYYRNAICNSFLKSITQNFEDGVPNNPNTIFDMIWSNIELSDEERQRREENERERQLQRQEEIQRRIDEEKRYEEEARARAEERRRQEDIEKQERDRRYEEERQRREQQRREDRAELERKRQEEEATRHQCNTCALTSRCSMAFRRPNCASYRPR